MKFIFGSILLTILFTISGYSKTCPDNPDKLYNRKKVIKKLAKALNKSVPDYPYNKFKVRDGRGGGFYIQDLTNPSNKEAKFTDCVNFYDKHLYHFVPVDLHFSHSHIAFLEGGKIKIFKSINCHNSKDSLDEIISYLHSRLEKTEQNREMFIRLNNYRRYGGYSTVDEFKLYCNRLIPMPPNPDPLYKRYDVLLSFIKTMDSPNRKYFLEIHSGIFQEEGRAIGYFIYDLTEPSNRQKSLSERVDFKDGHIYHFAYIDLPYSFSNIAILENGTIKTFRSLNCKSIGDNLEDVLDYIKKKLRHQKNRNEIVERVRNYRKYGVYASYNGSSIPNCSAIKAE